MTEVIDIGGNIEYIFDCPIHGLETQVMCFRAFDETLLDRWKKYQVQYAEVDWVEGEAEKVLENVRRSYT